MEKSPEDHTFKRFDGELNTLHLMLLEMGGLALNQLENALKSLEATDTDLARQVIRKDEDVDALEIRVDREIQQLFARRAPVGGDLRMVLAASKSVTELEEIGDNAVNIAALVTRLYDNEDSDPSRQLLYGISHMGEVSRAMLEAALNAYDQLDETAARYVIQEHEQLDVEFQSGLRRLVTFVMEDSRNVGHMVVLALVIKALERAGDHSKKIAENVIFYVRGEDVRHREDAVQGHSDSA